MIVIVITYFLIAFDYNVMNESMYGNNVWCILTTKIKKGIRGILVGSIKKLYAIILIS